MTKMVAVRFFLGIALLLSQFLGAAHAERSAAAETERAPVDEQALAVSYASTYKLGAGDLITVVVFGEADLSKEKIRLSDAGTVFYPVLGEIRVLGLTVGDLERKITEGLRGRYLVNPRVSVQIEEYRPFYINGMVSKPGSYPFQPGLTVRKAASIAGGFRERASLQKIFVIREGDPAQRPQKVDLNEQVNPGDIITVEESFF